MVNANFYVSSPEELGRRIETRRKELGLSRPKVARAGGIPTHVLIGMERGRINPRLSFEAFLRVVVKLLLLPSVDGQGNLFKNTRLTAIFSRRRKITLGAIKPLKGRDK
jgi:transcriptional regulator with XRE-family HTH domain